MERVKWNTMYIFWKKNQVIAKDHQGEKQSVCCRKSSLNKKYLLEQIAAPLSLLAMTYSGC
jgi:hypothetical protein